MSKFAEMATARGRGLGIDFGSRRIGFAVSDAVLGLARPLEVWRRRSWDDDLIHVAALCAIHEIDFVVVGMPNHLDGSAGSAAERAREFADALTEKLGNIEVRTRDEGLTTFEAERMLRERKVSLKDKKRLVDAYAALVILQEELDERGPC